MIGPQIRSHLEFLHDLKLLECIIDNCILSKEYGIENVNIPSTILPQGWYRLYPALENGYIRKGWKTMSTYSNGVIEFLTLSI